MAFSPLPVCLFRMHDMTNHAPQVHNILIRRRAPGPAATPAVLQIGIVNINGCLYTVFSKAVTAFLCRIQMYKEEALVCDPQA
jgi:hypothetical protein